MYPALESRADVLKMLEELRKKRGEMLAQCSRLPAEELNQQLSSTAGSPLEVLAHVAWAAEFMVAAIRKNPDPLSDKERPRKVPQDLAAIGQAFARAHAGALSFLDGCTDATLANRCSFGSSGEAVTVGGVLFHLVEHEIHHCAPLLDGLAEQSAR